MMFSDNFSSMGGYALGYGFHKLFAIAFVVGLILFVAWALKNLKKDQLKNWAVWLLVIGTLGLLLTSSFGTFGYGHSYSKGGRFGMMGPGMFNCMQDEECHEEMEDSMNRMMEQDEQ